jgi:hypothetical protein
MPLAAQRVLDLDRRQRTRLTVEQLKQRPARPTALVASRGQRRLRAVHPGLGCDT